MQETNLSPEFSGTPGMPIINEGFEGLPQSRSSCHMHQPSCLRAASFSSFKIHFYISFRSSIRTLPKHHDVYQCPPLHFTEK